MKKIAAKTIFATVSSILLLVSLAGCSDIHESPQTVSTTYIEAAFQGNSEAVGKLIHPDALAGYYKVNNAQAAYYLLEDDAESALKWIDDRFGSEWECSYEMLSAQEGNNRTKQEIKSTYEDYGLTVEDVWTVEFETAMENSEIQDIGENLVTVVKIDGKWYLDCEENITQVFYTFFY